MPKSKYVKKSSSKKPSKAAKRPKKPARRMRY